MYYFDNVYLSLLSSNADEFNSSHVLIKLSGIHWAGTIGIEMTNNYYFFPKLMCRFNVISAKISASFWLQ
jgi:hypothetical protein